jgi:hypothetical protein
MISIGIVVAKMQSREASQAEAVDSQNKSRSNDVGLVPTGDGVGG